MVGDARHFGEEVDAPASPTGEAPDGCQGSDAWLGLGTLRNRSQRGVTAASFDSCKMSAKRRTTL
jgi:hypothetical protein